MNSTGLEQPLPSSLNNSDSAKKRFAKNFSRGCDHICEFFTMSDSAVPKNEVIAVVKGGEG